MRPGEYIAELKRAHPTPVVRASDVPPSVTAELHERGIDVARAVDSMSGLDHAASLADALTPHLPGELRERLARGEIAVGTIARDDPNAYTRAVAGGHVIVFHQGLIRFIYRIARILATRAHVMGDIAPGADLSETARLIAEAFWWLQETGSAFGPDYPVTREQRHFANMLAVDAESFLIAHEFGHVAIDLKAQAGGGVDESAHDIEHLADMIGLSIVMELDSAAPKDAFRHSLKYAGAEFVLQIFDVLSRLGFTVSDSHPAAAERLAQLRLFMRSRCEPDIWTSLTMLSRFFAHLFDQIRDTILDPTAHAEFYAREANEIVTALNTLLKRCSGGTVPDYVTFRAQATTLFNRGYPHEILKIAASVAGRFFANTTTSASDQRQEWVDFQRFKLLLSFVQDNMPEPARSLFLRALRIPE